VSLLAAAETYVDGIQTESLIGFTANFQIYENKRQIMIAKIPMAIGNTLFFVVKKKNIKIIKYRKNSL